MSNGSRRAGEGERVFGSVSSFGKTNRQERSRPPRKSNLQITPVAENDVPIRGINYSGGSLKLHFG